MYMLGIFYLPGGSCLRNGHCPIPPAPLAVTRSTLLPWRREDFKCAGAHLSCCWKKMDSSVLHKNNVHTGSQSFSFHYRTMTDIANTKKSMTAEYMTRNAHWLQIPNAYVCNIPVIYPEYNMPDYIWPAQYRGTVDGASAARLAAVYLYHLPQAYTRGPPVII